MENVHKKIRAVEFDRLPEDVQKAFPNPPLYSEPVWHRKEGFRLLSPDSLDHPAPQALFPKLGIKSWRDSGSLAIIYKEINIRSAAERILQIPTDAQLILAKAWINYLLPFRLHLFPYVDFSNVTEVRFLANTTRCLVISACLRGQSVDDYKNSLPQITEFAKKMAKHLSPASHILDVGHFISGEIRLVDVNPALNPAELSLLE